MTGESSESGDPTFIAKKPDEVATPEQLKFERELFSKGSLIFNVAQSTAEADKHLQERKQFWDSNTTVDEKFAAESFARELHSAEHRITWQQRYSGLVPRNWDDPYKVAEDFKRAHELMPNTPLSNSLVDAGITYPDAYVNGVVATTQRLNRQQLAWYFVGRDHRPDLIREVSAVQRGFGVPRREIKAAKILARNVTKRMAEEKSQRSSPETLPTYWRRTK